MAAARATAGLATVGLLGLTFCAGLVVVVLKFADDGGTVPPGPASAPTAKAPTERAAPNESGPAGTDAAKEPAGPRRIPVAGRPGHWVVMLPDGSSYLEAPDGSKTQLAEAGPVLTPVLPTPAPPPARRPAGQLVVCDAGVVDVPTGAVITLVGKDKVVTRDDDGGATTYFVDGRVERLGRSGRPIAAGKP